MQAKADVESAVASDLVRRTFGVSIKAGTLIESSRSVRVIASTDAIDSYGEIVDQSWILDRYTRNPTVLYNHARAGGLFTSTPAVETLPIGFASDVAVVDGHLEATLNFVDERATPMAEMVWQGVRQGSLRAVSVGFRPRDVKTEKVDDVEVYRLQNNELFEISVVPLPANSEAVAKSAETNRLQLRRICEETMTIKQDANAAQPTAPMPATVELSTPAPEAPAPEAAELARLKAENEELRAERAKRLADEEKAAAEQRERLAALEAERAVEQLIGKTATPAMAEPLRKLHRLSFEIFTELAAALPELNLAGVVVQPAPIETPTTKNASPEETADQKLARLLRPQS